MSSRRPRKRRKHYHHARKTPPGSPPGIATPEPASRPGSPASEGAPGPGGGQLKAIAYGPESLSEHDLQSGGEAESIRGSAPVLWIDVVGRCDSHTLAQLSGQFRIHPLALEDVVNTHQRPKLKEYDEHQFLVLRAPTLETHEDGESEVHSTQVSIFLGRDYVLTVQEHQNPAFTVVAERIRAKKGKIRSGGADYLAYALVDAIVDFFFPILHHLGDEVDRLEEEIIEGRCGDALQRIYALKRELMELRRVVYPLRDVLVHFYRGDVEMVESGTQVYFRDCYDHTVQVMDVLESIRDTASNLMDLQQNAIAQRMNEVMKVLTIIATVFIPLSFLAGLYGMNFDGNASPWNMPELRWRYGYPLALGLMVAVASGMVTYFWRKGWLTSSTTIRREASAPDS